MAITLATIKTTANDFESTQQPTAAEWNARVYDAHQTEAEKRDSLSSGFYALPTLTADNVNDKVDVGNLDCLIGGKRYAGTGYVTFVDEETGEYSIQLMADGTLSKSIIPDADYLTIGTAEWTLATTTIGTPTVTAEIGKQTIGSTGNVTSAGSIPAGNLVMAGASSTDIVDAGIGTTNAAAAVAASHVQNTDTHTTSPTWYINGTETGFRFDAGVPQYTLDGGDNWVNFPVAAGSYVAGPSSSIDNYLVVFNGTGGNVIKALAITGAAVSAAVDDAHEHANTVALLDDVTQGLIDHPDLLLISNPHGIDADEAVWNALKIAGVTVNLTGNGVGKLLGFDGTNFVPLAPGGLDITGQTESTTAPVPANDYIVAHVAAAGAIRKLKFSTILATSAETDTGTATGKALTPAGFVASRRNVRWIPYRVVGPNMALVADDSTPLNGKLRSPIGGTIVDVIVDNDVPGSTGVGTYDVHLNGTTIFSTNPTIDDGESSSADATTPAALITTTLAIGGLFTYFCDGVQTTAAKGLVFWIGVREA